MSAPESKRSVLVTRPAAEAALWVADLQAQGLAAEALPLIDIVAVDDPGPARAYWNALASYAALMFVSGNAVQFFFEARPGGLVGFPPHVRCMAPGPGTAKRLLAVGVPAGQIDTPRPEAAQFDSQSLWEALGHRPWLGRRVLIVRGQSSGSAGSPENASSAGPADAAAPGRDWLASRLRDSGAVVDFVSVYQRRVPQLDAIAQARIARSQRDGTVWLFSSSEALIPLQTMPGRQGHDWSQARAIATHPRIAQAARDAGWGVVIESRPALADIVASIELLAS